VARFLYQQARDQLLRLPQVYAAFPQKQAVEIDEVLNLMHVHGLIRATFQHDAFQLNPAGVMAVNDGSVVELCLGLPYIVQRAGPATVHIIVRAAEGETGGSGFFSADYSGWIVTAAHNLRGKQLVRIEDSDRKVIPHGEARILLGPVDLDLGLVKCEQPLGVIPIPIEWRPEVIRPPQELLILGYPPYPRHLAALHHSRAELHAVTRLFNGNRDSMIISSVTRPGFSGGPVLSDRGFAIGVVEQENAVDRGAHPLAYFSAVPTRYCRELNVPEA
jgi:trypsin-like peptidase